MFKKKTVVVGSIKEFMNGKTKPSKVRKPYALIPLAVAPLLTPAVVGAKTVTAQGTADGIYNTMLHAFDPLITLVQALAYPVAMVVVLGGALFIMIGNKEKGFTMIQGAGLGYVLVQLTPLVLNILVQAMKAV